MRSIGCRKRLKSFFADNGSTDRLDAIAETLPRVRVLHMSRNYGQTAALMADSEHIDELRMYC